MRKSKLLLTTSLGLLLTFGVVGCGAESAKSKAAANQVNGQATEEHGHGGEDHSHGAYEWMGEFEFKAGTYMFHFGPSEDETMDVGFIKLGDNIVDLEHHAEHLMATEKVFIKQDSEFEAKPDYAYTLEMDKEHGHIHFKITEEGSYAIVTEHMPHESNMQIFDENEKEIKPTKEHEGAGHDHEHDYEQDEDK